MALLKITYFWSNLLAWGYQHNFPIWGYQHNFPIWGYRHIFGALVWYMSFYAIFWIIRLHWLLICMVTIRYKSMGVNAWHRARADLSCNECSELAKGVLRAKTGMGVYLNVSTGPEQNIKREPTVRD